jgi:hypothetical protein
LLHAAAALAHTARLSGAISEQLNGIRSNLIGLILHVVSRASLQIGIAGEGTCKKVALTAGYFADVIAALGLICDDPDLLRA